MKVDFRQQLSASRHAIVLIVIFASIPIGLTWLIHLIKGVPVGDLTRDPLAVLDAHIYTGFLSQLGIFGWAGAAAVCIFSAHLLPVLPGAMETRRFLSVAAAVTLTLGLDDVFLLHEQFFPYHVGIHEHVVYVAYVSFVTYFLARFRATILATEYLLLLLALSLFAVSVLSDIADGPLLFEDGAKFAGIVAWFAYFFRTADVAIKTGFPSRGGVPPRLSP